MMSFLKLVVLSVLLSACAHNDKSAFAEKDQALREYIVSNALNSVKQVNSFRFYGWNSLSNDFIVLSSSPRRRYLIELSGFCHDIPWAHTIIVNRGHDTSLHARFDSVSAVDSPEIKCIIKTIYPITKAQFKDIQTIDKPAEE
ncbi:hypothetical protein tinsulaeT_17320 [Thalassotalea insulae]|uniref:Lipoprotein n=1 Tax=Thalassotalea insulae TaxID=2056778 RepID=A0ABQ6GUR2_9GAMM|nr:DUF6491 family protein [Thalassotalea insulae]GLX78392.1 hypothetical protein tinsulaeT_17320 [Thalassotalea insulae]